MGKAGGGEGVVLKAKIFKRKYEQKLEYPEGLAGGGWGFKTKSLSWEGYGYFLEQQNIDKLYRLDVKDFKVTLTSNGIVNGLLSLLNTKLKLFLVLSQLVSTVIIQESIFKVTLRIQCFCFLIKAL